MSKWCVGILLMVGMSAQAAVVWDDAFNVVSTVWSDGFDGAANTNLTVFLSGGGASVTQSGGQMVLNTVELDDGCQAAVSTVSDETGTVTSVNGAPLYDFYDHQVAVRFDIAAVYGIPIGPNQRNVFYFSIGDDSGGNFLPHASGMDNGLGFRLEKLDVGAGGFWRLEMSQLVGGVETQDLLLANLSGVPSALIYILAGTNGTIQLEGATAVAVGGTTDWSGGGSTLSGSLPEISANISGYTLAFGADNLGAVSGETVVVLDAFSVDVVDGGLNPNWTVFENGAGASVSKTGGQLVLDTAGVGNSRQAAVNTLSDETGSLTSVNGAPLYNFYDHQVSVRFDIASIDGAPDGGGNRNVFYFTIGDDSDGNFFPQGSLLDNGLGFRLAQLDTGSGAFWRLELYQLIGGAETQDLLLANLSGVPTALVYTLEGTTGTIQLEGATATAVGGNTDWAGDATTMTGSLPDLSANISGYTLAFGAHNLGDVTTDTVVALDAFSASVVEQTFTIWAGDWGVDIGHEEDDYDGDLIDNFGEYALGGDPTDSGDQGILPVFGVDGGSMVYVHPQRTDDPTLSYHVEITEDLVSSRWIHACTAVAVTNVTGGTFDFITNTIPTTADQAFVRLRVDGPGDPNWLGPTPIRFYTGNLSVDNFISYFDEDPYQGGQNGMTEGLVDIMQRNNFSVMCDYVTWPIVELNEGAWDFSFHLANAEMLNDNGLGYNIFSWLHFPPTWYEQGGKFVEYVNLETGNSIPQMSLWSPDLPNVFDNYYRELSSALGDRIEFVRIAMPSEYGEIGYCVGMTKWLRPQEFAERGYWCGDDYAKADFRASMMAKYGSLWGINIAWGTGFMTVNDIAMPDTVNAPGQFTSSASARRWWVDFIDWYQQAWVECLTEVTGIIAGYFPDKELIGSLGYGNENPEFGNDQGRHVEAMKPLGLSCQSPGDVGYFPTRRVSSACRHYQVPCYTEPPAGVSPDRELNRIFMDISNGVQTWFDYLSNVDDARHYFLEYKKYITGEPPRSNVAVWHPTMDHWLHPDLSWSQPIYDISDQLRDVMAYEIVDDRMISSGALDTLGIRQLVLAGAEWLDADAWAAVHDWVGQGGVLIVLAGDPIADIDGGTAFWNQQVVASIPVVTHQDQDLAPVWAAGAKSMGSGKVLTVDTGALSNESRAVVASRFCFYAGSQVGLPEENTKLIDGIFDGVLSTRFDYKILYFNSTTEDKTLTITYREDDFPAGAPRPCSMSQSFEIPARTIIDVPLH